MLVASGLTHRFGHRELYRNVNLTLKAGDVTVIEGPSGCGKSTLLAILGGLLDPVGGSVERRPVGNEAIAWILQGTNSLPARSVLDNAAIYRRIDGGSYRRSRNAAKEALVKVGLDELASHRARQLSGGENQRLCVARALACDRPIVLADEPTSQLDRANSRRVMAELAKQGEQGRVVIVVTHDLEAIPPGVETLHLDERGLTHSRIEHTP